MDFKAIIITLAAVVFATIVMVKMGWATHSSPFTVATSKKDKITAQRMLTTGSSKFTI